MRDGRFDAEFIGIDGIVTVNAYRADSLWPEMICISSEKACCAVRLSISEAREMIWHLSAAIMWSEQANLHPEVTE